jgi:hypothetical protein
MPLLRTPMHMSYLQALGGASPGAADYYLRLALRLLAAREVPPSFLLHPTDVLDVRDAPRLGYFPGMARPAAEKLAQLDAAMSLLVADFDVVPLAEAASRLTHVQLPQRRLRARRRATVGVDGN